MLLKCNIVIVSKVRKSKSTPIMKEWQVNKYFRKQARNNLVLIIGPSLTLILAVSSKITLQEDLKASKQMETVICSILEEWWSTRSFIAVKTKKI